MTTQDTVEFVLSILAAYGRGDIDEILAVVAPDVDWQSPATRTQHEQLPWCTPCHSPADVEQFYAKLGPVADPYDFELIAITAQDDRVVLEGRNRGKIKATGRSYEHDWVMLFTVRDGMIVRFRHYFDTADVLPAFA